MTYKFLTSKNRDEYFDKILKFCQSNTTEENLLYKHHSLLNYDTDQWYNKNNTLLYLLYKEKRFDEFGYCVHIDDCGNIIAGAGLYRFDLDKNLVISSRLLKDRKYRGKNRIISGILNEQFKIIHEKNINGIIFTHDINDPNKKKNVIERVIKLWWANENSVPELKDIKILDFNVLIKNTPQFILYKMFDGYEFDWETIRV